MNKKHAIELVKSRIQPYLNELDELFAPLLSSEWGKRFAITALGLASVILVMVIISVFTDWYANIRLLYTSKSTSIRAENNISQLVAYIPQAHLFGKYGVIEKSGILPITSLQIELTGIIMAKPESLSRVIISEQGRHGKIYQTGDTLESGVKVYGITEDSVVLDNGGQLEKLPLRHPSSRIQKIQPPAVAPVFPSTGMLPVTEEAPVMNEQNDPIPDEDDEEEGP